MTISWTIEMHDSIPSTQDIAKGHARLGRMEGTVVQAREQTAGKGRHGRQWVSKPGNLFLSFILNPPCAAMQIGQISVLIGLALAFTVRQCVAEDARVRIKWPNDVMINDEKCAGILLESELSGPNIRWVIVGIGVNIAAAPPGLGTSLSLHPGRGGKSVLALEFVRRTLLGHIGALYEEWLRSGFANIRQEWLRQSHLRGEPVRIKIGPQIEEGIFYGIDDMGNLQIQDKNLRLRVVTAGEIYGQGAT